MTDLIHIETLSTDKETKINVNNPLGFDGQGYQRLISESLAVKIVVAGSITYIAQAKPGTAQATARWRAKKIDESTPGTTIITWAGGTSNFDNVATDLSSLTYS